MSENRLNFADYNFDNLVTQLRNIVLQEDAWKDVAVEAGTGNFLIELFCYVAEMLMYYLERRAQESYIDTAQLRSSVVRLVGLLNYRPKRQVSSTGNLKFELPGGWYDGYIVIPRGIVVKTSANKKFIVKDGGMLNRGLTEVTLLGIQGELKTQEYTSDGTASQEIHINAIDVENSTDLEDPTIRLTVDGELWTLVENFVDSGATSNHYTQETQLDGTVKIIFGDGRFGKIPINGSTVVVEYIETDGLSGNVYSTGQITSIETTIYDTDNNDVTSLLTVTNSSNFLGGDDAEDKDEIRQEAPLVFATGQRAVTRQDYITIIENIAGVASAYVWGERDVAHPDITMFNKLKIVTLLQEWEIPDATFKVSIAEQLQNKEQLTVWLEFLDPVIIDTIVDVDLAILPTYQQSTIISNVSTKLDELFALGTVKLGEAVYYSDIVGGIDGVIGVDYCHVAIKHKELLGVGDGGLTVFTKTMHLLPLLNEYVEIYVNTVKIAHDNGSGFFIEDVPGTINVATSTVDYVSGIVSIEFLVPPVFGDDIYVVYRQDQEGDIVVDQDEIAKLVEKNITLA